LFDDFAIPPSHIDFLISALHVPTCNQKQGYSQSFGKLYQAATYGLAAAASVVGFSHVPPRHPAVAL
jgi:hypothetical protein